MFHLTEDVYLVMPPRARFFFLQIPGQSPGAAIIVYAARQPPLSMKLFLPCGKVAVGVPRGDIWTMARRARRLPDLPGRLPGIRARSSILAAAVLPAG